VDGFTGPSGDNVVHEVKELDAPPALLGTRPMRTVLLAGNIWRSM